MQNEMEKSLGYQLVEAEAKLSEGPVHDYKVWLLKKFQYMIDINLIESKQIAKKYNAKLKECYHNCWNQLPSSFGRYKYFEGYVWSESVPIPLDHAWLVKDGKVIDPTLVLPTKFSSKRMGDEYLGIEIPVDFVLKQSFKIRKTGPFIFDYFESFSGQKIYH